jgi:hypothetical protein
MKTSFNFAQTNLEDHNKLHLYSHITKAGLITKFGLTLFLQKTNLWWGQCYKTFLSVI